MRTIEVYDSFDPKRLLDVKFEISDKPEYVRTCRTSYASTYELMFSTERYRKINGVHRALG